MTTETAPVRQRFSYIGSVGAVEYTMAILRQRCRRLDKEGFTHKYDDYVLETLETLLDYLKTQYSERCGCDFPEPREEVL
jgi:hypothetical protein